jgi:hypothetical protein
VKRNKIIQFILAILLFGCLADMPYGYFQLVRLLSLIGFSILAYVSFGRGENNTAWIFVALAVLFQPMFKISLGRDLWNIVDVVVGAWLLYRVLFRK